MTVKARPKAQIVMRHYPPPSTPEQRMRLKRFYRDHARVTAKRERLESQQSIRRLPGGFRFELISPKLPEHPAYPEDCREMSCGAKTRKGTPCKRTDLYASCRCKFHGGMSTGPKTADGKQRSAQNGFKKKSNIKFGKIGMDTKSMNGKENRVSEREAPTNRRRAENAPDHRAAKYPETP